MEEKELIVLSNDANELANKICENLGVKLYAVEKTVFANKELKIKIPVNVREKVVFYIHSFENTPPLAAYGELWLVNDALKRAAAEKIINVLPFIPFTRADLKDEPRVSIAASLMADLTEKSGANRIITTDLHSGQIQGFYSIPVDNLYADKIIAEHLKSKEFPINNAVIGAPDAGAIKRARSIAEKLGGLGIVIIDKRRPLDSNGKPIPNQPEAMHVIGDVKGKYVLFFDDMIDTGKTLVVAAKTMKEKGALGVYAAATHGIFSPKDGTTAEDKLFKEIEQLIVTDTIPQKTHLKKQVVSVAELYAEAIKRTFEGRSLSELFN